MDGRIGNITASNATEAGCKCSPKKIVIITSLIGYAKSPSTTHPWKIALFCKYWRMPLCHNIFSSPHWPSSPMLQCKINPFIASNVWYFKQWNFLYPLYIDLWCLSGRLFLNVNYGEQLNNIRSPLPCKNISNRNQIIMQNIVEQMPQLTILRINCITW